MSIRIATFNLESFGDPHEETASFAARLGRLRDRIVRFDADVLCLQELDARRTADRHRTLAALDALLEGTPYSGASRVEMVRAETGAPADRHNLVILSRLPVIERRQILHEFVPPLAYLPVTAIGADNPLQNRFDRPFLYAALALPDGRRLHAINVHLRAPLAAPIPGQKLTALSWRTAGGWAEGFYLAALRRSGQALEVRLFVERLFDREPDALIAVCGDFNADGREVPVRIVQAGADDTGNPALAGRELRAIERRVAAERRYSVLHAGTPVMLDHILVSPALLNALRTADVDNDGLADEIFDADPARPMPDSFHAPVIAEFALAG